MLHVPSKVQRVTCWPAECQLRQKDEPTLCVSRLATGDDRKPVVRSMYLASAFQTDSGICRLSKGVYSDGKRALGCQDSGDFALELGGCLPNE